MTTTDRQTAIETIRAFLALPGEALPSAQWVAGFDDRSSPWPALRDYLRPEERQRYAVLGDRVRLHADRDGWRDGVVVKLD